MFRRILTFTLALILCFSCISGGFSTVHAESLVFQVEDSYINPLYADIITEVDFDQFPVNRTARAGSFVDSTEELSLVFRQGMKNRENVIMLYINMPDADTAPLKAMIREAFDLALIHTGVPTEGDYLRWQHGAWEYGGEDVKGYYADDDTVNWEIPFKISYYTTAAQEAEIDDRIDALLDELDVYDATDYEIIRAIYDYICENVTYDYENLEDDNYRLKYSAYAALINNTAVCQGYALLFYRLALELGIDSRLIAGDGGGRHGWNIAKIDTLYYNLDSTWDAGNTTYRYFLRSPANFTDHTRDDEYETAEFHAKYPMASNDYVISGCNHSYTSSITLEATCVDTGIRTYRCSKCGNSYTETIDALGHNAVTVNGYAATCTETGLTDGSRCSRCNVTLTQQEEIPAAGHKWNDGVVTTEPTEESAGVRTYTCTVCKETKTESIPPLEHTHRYSESVTAPTCTEGGFTTYTCSCGESYTGNETAALGHNAVTLNGYAATCTETGLTDGSRCSRCNVTLTQQEEIPAAGHKWNDGVVTTEPTEESAGVRTYTCTVCEETKTEPIPPLEHSHRYSESVTAPTCTEGGFTTYTCSCGHSYTGNETAALGHNAVTINGYAATCTETGLTDGSRCSRCNVPLTQQEEIPAAGHKWNDGVVTTEPTEESAGVRTYTCTVCEETKTESIPPLDHTHNYTESVTAPTCTETGYTTYTCTCGESYTGKETAALGHNWDDGVVTTEPTEEQPGVRTFTCTRCNETRTEEIPWVKPESTVSRIYGTSRCATAIAAADQLKTVLHTESFDTIIITNGDNFADALTGTYLATAKNAPILLHRASGAADNQAYILENLSEDGIVYILGGTIAVPESVDENLREQGIRVQRISGTSRFDTNLEILNCAGVSDQEILITSGWEFADSLSASATGLPILMVNTKLGTLTEDQISFLKAHPDNSYTIIGGSLAVSEDMEAMIELYVNMDVQRIYGTSREATSTAVAAHYFPDANAVFLAYSRDFPDGLCGGPLAHAMNAPLVLINRNAEQYAAEFIRTKQITTGYVLGGPLVISDASIAVAFGN